MKKYLILLIIVISSFFLLASNKTKAVTKYSMAAMVNTSGSNLNVRTKPSTTSEVITKLKDLSYLTLISSENDWYYAEYANQKYGYINKNYLKLLSGDVRTINTSGSRLNVRKGYGTNYSIIDSLNDQEYVLILASSNNFSKILYKGNQIGYVSSAYLSSNYNYPKLNLNVIDYKQYDSRWANNKIASTNYTFKQIGCLTTNMAMVESYRTKTTITPTAMEAKLSYTADGSMYWPSNYKFSYANSTYLQTIYSLLRTGKPVIIGATNNYNGQHWVVIYGYQESNTLSASNFLIRDPGSSYRTNLQSFLNSYPNIKKLAYY